MLKRPDRVLNKMKNVKKFTLPLGQAELILEFGEFAWQANGAVRAKLGQTEVLATAVMGATRTGIDYFPMTVDYEEKLYAVGKIKGSRFIKREGRPTDIAILTARLIDRTFRPLFDQRIRRDVQVMISVLSFDGINDPDILALNAASAALMVSDIPWDGPVGGVRVAQGEKGLIVNPTYEEVAKSPFDLVLSGKKHLTNMIEVGANEVSETKLAEAMKLAEQEVARIADFIGNIAKEIGVKKQVFEFKSVLTKDQRKAVTDFVNDKIEAALYQLDNLEAKQARSAFDEALKQFVLEQAGEDALGEGLDLAHEIIDEIFTTNILKKDRRPDGRALNELRPLDARVGVLPRPHGSGVFERGLTQALSVVTLGAPGDELTLDGMEHSGTQRFMHHYNFPPFCSGESKPMRGPGRREIGHGALAEKALKPMLPNEIDFPYAIRVVTEILSSNGSTSMASTCASCLALMDAGVPIKKSVAGISMGAVFEDEKHYKVLTDIQGPEDHSGHMDFKVAGTKEGITAIQLDTKVPGLPLIVLIEAMDQAKEARFKILEVMTAAIAAPRPELSPFAPRIISMRIDTGKIRAVIGSGGETINKIIDDTKAKIDIEDDGTVFITGENQDSAERAKKMIETIVRPLVPGERFEGRVVSMLNFGAFVEIAPGRQGLVHVSELADGYVKRVEDVVKIGDIIPVVVMEIDPQGRLNLSRKRALKGGGAQNLKS